MAGVEFIKVTPGKTRKVRIKFDTSVRGQHVAAGTIAEIEDHEAYNLVIAQKAEFYVEPVKESVKAAR